MMSSRQSRKKDRTRHVFEITVRVMFRHEYEALVGEPAVAGSNRGTLTNHNRLNHSKAAMALLPAPSSNDFV
jgi:hypothetical protein